MINHYHSRVLPSLIAVAFFLVCEPFVTAQEPLKNQMALLKRGVVIVTTYDRQGTPLLQGSGFFIEPEEIVTNLHVVNHASKICIETFDRRIATVQEVIATNEKADLALLRIPAPASGATVLQLEAAVSVEGESITVLSNPQGSHWKITRGQVGLIWEFEGIGKRMQITAAIFPGSSGGPVVNDRGHVIGIAALHAASADDLNFAVPVESLRDLQAQSRLPVANL